MSRHVVAAAADFPAGTRRLVTLEGRPIVIFNVGGEYFALLNRCPHQGGNLGEGILVGLAEADGPGHVRYTRKGEILKCPWHGWEFDVRTGESWCEPDSVLAKRYAVSIEPGEALAKGPFVAETFAVSVERSYVVVEV